MREWCESGDKDRQGEKGEIGACFRWAGFDSARCAGGSTGGCQRAGVSRPGGRLVYAEMAIG
jgi:hypothetical protein